MSVAEYQYVRVLSAAVLVPALHNKLLAALPPHLATAVSELRQQTE